MPRGDGTGPMGKGPMTGRGRGFCITDAAEIGKRVTGLFRRGTRRGMGQGRGQGQGQGQGLGLGRGQGRTNNKNNR